MSDIPGMGVMIHQLFGSNRETVETFQGGRGKKIVGLKLVENDNGALHFTFEDGTRFCIRDDGRSCCESRYMTTDDDLQAFVGATLLDAEIKTGPTTEGEYGEEHEVSFLQIKTSAGEFTCETHNEHNGYYGGFWIVCEPLATAELREERG